MSRDGRYIAWSYVIGVLFPAFRLYNSLKGFAEILLCRGIPNSIANISRLLFCKANHELLQW
jgi:hypothetical protein